jgi:hypothetical protein
MHRLALHLGRTVHELEASLSYTELLDWVDYYAVQPFGEERGDIRIAQLCKAVVDFHYSIGGSKNPHQLADYVLFKNESLVDHEEVVVSSKPEDKPRKGARVSQELLTQLFLASAVKKRKD